MKALTLDDVIKRELQDDEFRMFYEEVDAKMKLAEQIIKLRKSEGLTQEQLANIAHTTQPVIARLEKGTDRRTPSLKLLGKIAHGLGRELNISFTTSHRLIHAK